MRLRKLDVVNLSALVVSLLIACACSAVDKLRPQHAKDDAKPEAPALDLNDCGDHPCPAVLASHTMTSAATFDAFATDESGLGLLGKSVKFFIDMRSPQAPVLHFINANFHEADGTRPEAALLHYKFAQYALGIPEDPAEYNQVTYFTDAGKRYYAGSIQRYAVPGGGEVYGVQFFPQDVITETTIVTALQLVGSGFHIAGAATAFVATGQQQTTATVGAQVAALGAKIYSINDLLGALDFIPMHAGEAVGYLRIFPTNQAALKATDIVLFDELPLDLTVVAGVMTKAYQDPNSHVNLKSRERGTPNMVLRSAAADNPALAMFADKPVHLSVTREGYAITAATDADVAAALAARNAKPWTATPRVPDARVLSFDEMCVADAAGCLALKSSHGAKAGNLGFLAHPTVLGRGEQFGTLSGQLGYDVSPRGIGVPLSFYDRLLDDAENAALKAKVAEFVALEKTGDLSTEERKRWSDELKAGFLAAFMPPEVLTAVRDSMALTIPDVKSVKVRSSANVEDEAGFNGAGLYDSYRAKPALPEADNRECVVVPKLKKSGAVRSKLVPATLSCAMKAVYASLWNVRAVDERSFARIDHTNAAMGLAILPAYDLESKVAANSVVVTRVFNTDDLAGYSISTHKKNNLVTNPAPGTHSELDVALFYGGNAPTSITTTRFALSKAGKPELTAPIYSREAAVTLVEITKTIEFAYCNARPDYYPAAQEHGCQHLTYDASKPRALDFELKYLQNGRFVCKQVREFREAR